jgi:hypothetical protein
MNLTPIKKVEGDMLMKSLENFTPLCKKERPSSPFKVKRSILSASKIIMEDEIQRHYQFQYLSKSLILEGGHGFGELALMNRTKRGTKRAATVTAMSNTHLAVLSKEDFQRVCLSQIEKRFDKILDFLMSFKICEGISKPTLS